VEDREFRLLLPAAAVRGHGRTSLRGGDLQAAARDQVLEHHRVVNDRDLVEPEVRILVRQRVEAVRAGGDDFLICPCTSGRSRRSSWPAPDRDTRCRFGRRIAGAALFLAEDRETSPALRFISFTSARETFLFAVVEAAGAADPEEVVDLLALLFDLRHRLSRAGPRPTPYGQSGREVPGLPLPRCGERVSATSVGNEPFHQHELAAHVDDAVHVLDERRGTSPRTARQVGAGPERLGVDRRPGSFAAKSPILMTSRRLTEIMLGRERSCPS